ncbi:TPA: hypothetical protein ACXNW8_001328 [Clostridium botulinum]|uniref:hypothetical protein n=1 Tax=Clostridium botulinum TaxID=1491 RepID=UPI001C9A9E3A|nr:hypothetical protein [Clostridium botulinum]MBY6909530.1 hypothetical protein [Clostridium botulinum]
MRMLINRNNKRTVNKSNIKELISLEMLKATLGIAKFIKWIIYFSIGMTCILTVIAFTKALFNAIGGM